MCQTVRMHGYMISFHCRPDLFDRMERFAIHRNIDRTSVLKLALHFHLNRLMATLHARGDATTSVAGTTTAADVPAQHAASEGIAAEVLPAK